MLREHPRLFKHRILLYLSMLFIPALMVIPFILTLCVPHVLSAPVAVRRQLPSMPSIEVSWVTDIVTSATEVTIIATDIVTVHPSASSSALPISVPITNTVTSSIYVTITDTDVITVGPPTPSLTPSITITGAVSIMTTTTADVKPKTSTSTVFEASTITTVSAPAKTATGVITASQLSTPTRSWSAPTQFSDLGSFSITKFAYGQSNMEMVNGIPASASAVTTGLEAVETDSLAQAPTWGNDSSVLQLFYPAGSINPSNDPQGGADFYATPLPLSTASSVTLEYSVFFPADFDWVQGGKLPGIYGGHITCSGGDDAKECFSTRMMWRKNGAGELYLYAPKDKQTSALCSAPPESVCDATYGLSVGRGSFYFTAGAWTNIRQTVSLNTPGQQDGGFLLEVNGRQIMNRTDVFYRDVPSPVSPPSDGDGDGDDQGDDVPTEPYSASPPQQTGDNVNGVLPPLLGGILASFSSQGQAFRQKRQFDGVDLSLLLPAPAIPSQILPSDTADSALLNSMIQGLSVPIAAPATGEPLMTSISYLTSPVLTPSETNALESGTLPEPIRFSGLFFSTFFGGNSAEYASPKDQYSWFKDFALTINS